MSKRICRIRYPTLEVIEQAVDKLRSLYPDDYIRWKGGGKEQARQAIVAAKWSFGFSRGKPCYERKLAAAAALFYEIIMLHPLADGNKRLAVVMLGSFLIKNKLPTPRPGTMYQAALLVVGREWNQEDVHQWLLRVYRSGRARKRDG